VAGFRSKERRWYEAGRDWLRSNWEYPIAVGLFAATAYWVLRGDFGSAGVLPQGTNALNTTLVYGFQQRYGLTAWLGPFTDWGQPLPGFLGWDPQDLLAVSGLVNPTTFVRVAEFACLVGSGVLTVWAARRLGAARLPALVAGEFFMLTAETPQFFEGHINSMISMALGPAFFVLVLLFFEGPTHRRGAALAITLFLLGSVGDLAYLYKFLFFSVPMALLLLVSRVWNQPYSRSDYAAFGSCGLLSLSLLSPWLIAEAVGSRPQLTTGITTTVVPFFHTSGESLLLAFIGFSGDNSFTLFHLGAPTYAWMYPATLPLFLVVPIAVGVSAVVLGRPREVLFYLSGLFAALIATGPEFPVLVGINRALYDRFPLFNNDPALFHWDGYYVLVMGLLLSISVTRLQRFVLSQPASAEGSFWSRLRGRPGRGRRSGSRVRCIRLRWAASRSQGVRVAIFAAAILIVAGSPIVANWEVMAKPPGTFTFPTNYTAGYEFVARQPGASGILSLPFGNIYERTPWGGVSASSELVAGIGTGRNLAIFEAGTPYSLALDELIGNGLAFGYSSNLTKILNLTGIGYVVETSYSNWSYTSDPIYNPPLTNLGLEFQTGLGASLYQNSLQQVYAIPSPATAVTSFTHVVVYDGGPSLVYSILDEPWFTARTPLLCLCDIPAPALPSFLDRASVLAVTPSALANLSSSQWSQLRAAGTPIDVIVGAASFNAPQGSLHSDPWNASNGQVIALQGTFGYAEANASLELLLEHGYNQVDVSLRANAPPGALAEVTAGGGGSASTTLAPLETPPTPLPYWNSSIVSAGINNEGAYEYNGTAQLVTLDGNRFVQWNFSAFNSTFQYLNFNLHDLRGANGLQITFKGSETGDPAPILQLLFNGTSVTVPSYLMARGSSNDSATYGFYFSDSEAGGATRLEPNLGNISRFVIGFTETGAGRSLLVSNLSEFNSSSGGFQEAAFGSVALGPGENLVVNTSGRVMINAASLMTKGQIGTPPPSRYLLPVETATPDRVTVYDNRTGWSLLQLAQTYSPLWTVAGPVSGVVPVLSDVGLSGWLIDVLHPGSLTFTYAGGAAISIGIVIETAGPVGFVAVVAISYWRGRRPRDARGQQGDHFGSEPFRETEAFLPAERREREELACGDSPSDPGRGYQRGLTRMDRPQQSAATRRSGSCE